MVESTKKESDKIGRILGKVSSSNPQITKYLQSTMQLAKQIAWQQDFYKPAPPKSIEINGMD